MQEMETEPELQIGNLLEVQVDDDGFDAVGKPSGPVTRFVGLVSGFLFIGVAGFLAFVFWGDAPLWMLGPLWLGLSLIGLWLIAGNLSAEKRVDFLRAGAATGELSWGKRYAGVDEIKGTMKLADIEKLNLGSESSGHLTGLTALYVAGEGAPWNGALITGTISELDDVRWHIKRLMAGRTP